MDGRDKKRYRSKGLRRTTLKTVHAVYGEVEYRRRVYEVGEKQLGRHCVYLLDENLDVDLVGLASTNLSELMVQGITELSYRGCAASTSRMTGQRVSAMDVWNVIQELGEKVCSDEKELARAHKAGKIRGEREVPVLFEEADGVYVSLQGKDRKQSGNGKAEIKEGSRMTDGRRKGKEDIPCRRKQWLRDLRRQRSSRRTGRRRLRQSITWMR